jgi:hypothetical protein
MLAGAAWEDWGPSGDLTTHVWVLRARVVNEGAETAPPMSLLGQ